MKDAFEQGITDEDADVYEVSEGWKNKEGKQITDKEYDKLSPKKNKNTKEFIGKHKQKILLELKERGRKKYWMQRQEKTLLLNLEK